MSVLAAFAAVEGEDGDARAQAAGEIGEHAAVFVVGVGDDEHERGAGVELAEHLREAEGVVGLAVASYAAVDGQLAAVARADALAGEVGGVGEVEFAECARTYAGAVAARRVARATGASRCMRFRFAQS